MKKTGLYGYVYDFSTDYDDIAIVDILDIHKYLMKNNLMNHIKKFNESYKMFRYIKKCLLWHYLFLVAMH